MVVFNLLPWRHHQKRYQTNLLLSLSIIACLLAMILSYFAHWMIQKQVHALSIKEKKAQAVIKNFHLQQKTRQEKYPPVLTLVKEIQQQQRNLQILFAQLSKENDDNICFTELTYQKDNIIFSGNAYSIYDFTLFLEKWPLALLFDEIKIKKIITEFPIVKFQFTAIPKK